MIPLDTEPRHFDVFLSYNSRERPAVEALANKLRGEGLNPWFDKEQLIPGTRWQDALASGLRAASTCAIFIGKDDLGNWSSEELDVAQNRAANNRDFRLIPVLLPSLADPFDPSPLPPFLLSRTWIDFRSGLDNVTAFRRLVCAIKGIPPGPEDGGLPSPSDKAKTEIVPYLGLDTFDEADAGLFFGRAADVQKLLEKLKAARFLAVIGGSGSGKSSLVRAGLVPHLRRNALPGSGDWLFSVFRPGARPLAELALHLVRLRGDDQRPGALTKMEQELGKDQRALHNVVRLRLASFRLKPEDEARQRVLLVVDQLEEIFTQCHDDNERTRFLENLLYAAAALDGRTIIVLTMRADFYHKCASYGGLSARIAAHQYLVGPMTRENLRQAIEEPARLVGSLVEPELLTELLTEVSNQPGELPLLEYALLEAWKRRREGKLTLKGYWESGGVKGALAQRAEAIFSSFSPSQKEITQRVMLRLTQLGEGTDDTRRRAYLVELATRTEEREAVAEVVNRLTDERLLTVTVDQRTGDQVVDVAHEALIRGWPRLRKWAEEDRAGLRTLLRLAEATHEWQREKRDEDFLYRGARLAVALEYRTRNESLLNELERDFLSASEALKLREEEQRQAAQRRELELLAQTERERAEAAQKLAAGEKQRAEVAQVLMATEKRSSSRLRYFLAGLAVLFIASVMAGIGAYRQRQQALELLYVADMKAAFLASVRGDVAEVRRLLEAHRRSSEEAWRFEWLWLWRGYHDERAELKGHAGIVLSAAYSPDGKTLASAGADRTVRLWDVQTGQELATLKGHTDNVRSVAFSPNGEVLASASTDQTVRLWGVKTRQELATLKGHTDTVGSVAFSPDGEVLASTSADQTVKLWDLQTRQELATLKGHADAVESVAFSPDGKTLASASDDQTVKLWDVRAKQVLATLKGHGDIVESVAFSPDGKTLASASDDQTVKLWDVQTRRELVTLKGHADLIRSVAFSPDGKTLASASADKTIKLWNLQTKQELTTLKGHTDSVGSVAFSPDGETLASASDDQTMKLWDARTKPEIITLRGHAAHVSSVVFSPDGKTLASTSDDQTVRLWDAHTTQELATLKGHSARILAAAFSPNGKTLATASDDQTLKLWDVQTRQELATLKGHTSIVGSVAFSPDGKTLASASDDQTLKLWDVQTRQELATLKGHTNIVRSLAFSPDGKMLASASNDETVRLWNVKTRKELATLKGHTSIVRSVVFSPDGRMLASASDDQTVRLWDEQTRQELATLKGHAVSIRSVAFSPNGKTLASAGVDKTIKLWDVLTRQELATLKDHTDSVWYVTFSPDGKTLASSSADMSVKLWRGVGPSIERQK